MSMEPLAKELRIGGFDLRQIKRIGDIAVYEQSKAGRILSYEVARIQVRKAETICGRSYPAREVYPSNETWGTDGFTILDLTNALERAEKWSRAVSVNDSVASGGSK